MGGIISSIGFGLLMLIAALWGLSFFVIVKQKRAVIIEVFGKFFSVRHAGLSLKPPFPFGKAVGVVNLQIQELSVNVNAKTKDNSFIEMPVKVQFQVIESKVKESFYELDNPAQQIKSYIFNKIRSKSSEKTLDELYGLKNDFEDDIQTTLKDQFSKYGYEVVNVLVDEPQPSKEIVDAYNRVLTSQKLKEAATNEGEALKIKVVKQAEAEAESKKLQGEGIANQRKAIIQGLKDSVNDMKSIGDVETKEVLNLILVTQYFDTLKEVGQSSSNTIMLPAGPAGLTSVADQIREAVISGGLIDKKTN